MDPDPLWIGVDFEPPALWQTVSVWEHPEMNDSIDDDRRCRNPGCDRRCKVVVGRWCRANKCKVARAVELNARSDAVDALIEMFGVDAAGLVEKIKAMVDAINMLIEMLGVEFPDVVGRVGEQRRVMSSLTEMLGVEQSDVVGRVELLQFKRSLDVVPPVPPDGGGSVGGTDVAKSPPSPVGDGPLSLPQKRANFAGSDSDGDAVPVQKKTIPPRRRVR